MSHIDNLDVNQPITTKKGKSSEYFEDFMYRITTALNPLEYETGEFTPELWDDALATDATPPTYSIQFGVYTRIGDMVYIQGRLRLSALGGLTTTEIAHIGGLPYMSDATVNNFGSIIVGWADAMANTGSNTISGYVQTSSKYINLTLWDVSFGVTQMLISEYGASGNILFSGTYKI